LELLGSNDKHAENLEYRKKRKSDDEALGDNISFDWKSPR